MSAKKTVKKARPAKKAQFADLVRLIEAEARAEGPEAEAQLEALRARFRGVTMPKTVTVQVAATRLNLPIGSVQRRVDAGLLDGYKDPVTGGYCVSVEAIEDLLKTREALRRSAALPGAEGPRGTAKKKTPKGRPLTHVWLIRKFAADQRVSRLDLARAVYWAMRREDAAARILKFAPPVNRGEPGAEKFLRAAEDDQQRAIRAYDRAVAAINRKVWARR